MIPTSPGEDNPSRASWPRPRRIAGVDPPPLASHLTLDRLVHVLTDIHVHLVGSDAREDCYIAPELRSSLLFQYLIRTLGLEDVDDAALTSAYRDRLLRWVDGSELGGVGLLALDGVYGDAGELDRERTQFRVSNDYCLEVAGRHPALIPICSINPRRADALAELERVDAAGAAALKLLPNSQGVDLRAPAHRPFWERMARLGLPLLTHTSFEHTIPPIDQSLGHPERLEPVLDEGVTVIAAHCASSGIAHWTEHFGVWRRMLRTYPNLYGDLSAMTSLARFRYVGRVLDDDLAADRVVLGSDFPIPCRPWLFLPKLGWDRCARLAGIENPLQRNLETLRVLGVGPSILRRGSRLLKARDGADGRAGSFHR